MSDLLELARGLHKQAKEEKSGKGAGWAAGLGTYIAGAKMSNEGNRKLVATGGKSRAARILSGIGAATEFGAIPLGIQVKRNIEKKAAEKKKKEQPSMLRPGVVAGIATASGATAARATGSAMMHRAAKSTVANSYRPTDVDRKNVKGFYENGKYVTGKTPGLQAGRVKDIASKSNKLMSKGVKVSKYGTAALIASPVVGALVGKAHRMMTEKKDK